MSGIEEAWGATSNDLTSDRRPGFADSRARESPGVLPTYERKADCSRARKEATSIDRSIQPLAFPFDNAILSNP